jgi:predicted nuclease of predicted toxin-antitoxin system
MKLKLDENLSRHLQAMLSHRQHDVLTAGDEGLLSQPDMIIAQAARGEGRMLMTLDLDFADLRNYPPGSHPGIVLFRPSNYGPLAVNQFVDAFVRDNDLEAFTGCLVVVEPKRIRIRRPEQ